MDSTSTNQKKVSTDHNDFFAFLAGLGLKGEIGEVTVSGETLKQVIVGGGMVLSGRGPHSFTFEQTEKGAIAEIIWQNELKYNDKSGKEQAHENIDRLVFEGDTATLHSHRVSPMDGRTLAVLEKDGGGNLVKEGGKHKVRPIQRPSEAKLTVTYSLSEGRLIEK